MQIGYARVSKQHDQDTAAQLRALTESGVERVFTEHASGGRWDRPELHRMLDQLRTDDVAAREVVQRRLLLCLHDIGTNAGLKRMCSGGGEDSFADLQYIRRRYVHKEQLRDAIGRVCNAVFQARDAVL